MPFKFEKTFLAHKKFGEDEWRLDLLFIPRGSENFFKDKGVFRRNDSKVLGEDEWILLHLWKKNMKDDLFLNKQIFYYVVQKYTIDWIFF